MSGTYFISDLHLDTRRTDVSAALADFLQRHRNCERLYILGDLFETWVGDDDDAPLAGQTADLLQDFTASGPQLFILVGNRDFLLGERFCHRVGGTLLADPTVIDLQGTPTLLMHGDSLCTGDAEYQVFRRQARDPDWQADLLAKPLAERRGIAARLRAMSLEANSNKAEDIMDVTPSEVERVMREHGVSQMIHGHTHRPKRHDLANGTRWVLGDWDRSGWAIKAETGKLELYSFPINTVS